MVSLKKLLPHCDYDLDIKGITLDSRAVKPGYLFAALPGQQVDGRSFIAKALEAGASALLVPMDSHIDVDGVHVIEEENPRLAFAKACATFYDKQPEMVVAVTGTNGKSSCVTFIRELWAQLGLKAASIGTLGITAPGVEIEGKLTTPDPAALQKNIAKLADHEVTHMAMEASSHGLDQYRLHGVEVSVAAFTNLSRDHLDYHETMDAYLMAKARLFSEVLLPGGKAVLNADIPEFDVLNNICADRNIEVLSYGHHGEHIQLLERRVDGETQHLKLSLMGKTVSFDLNLAGGFQVENILCSLGVVIAAGTDPERIVPHLSKLSGVPGRLEHMGANVYVDYAHTPDALQTVLEALRPHTKAKMIVLFGCGGDRDIGKRPEMGIIAKSHADQIIVTDDNPRSEDPDIIRSQILSTCPDALEIADRAQAIETAIDQMENGDLLLIAGKGHETGQIIKGVTHPFDDRALSRQILKNRGMI